LDAWATIVSVTPLPRTELPINIGVNPLGGLSPGFLPSGGGFIPGIIGGGATNFSALISWPYKFIVGSPYINFGLPQTVLRDGYWTINPYEYKAPPAEKPDAPYRLYNIQEDEIEEHDLSMLPEHADLVKKLFERVKFYASKENGWVAPQLNIMRPLANPRLHNWTWAPFWHLEEEETLMI